MITAIKAHLCTKCTTVIAPGDYYTPTPSGHTCTRCSPAQLSEVVSPAPTSVDISVG